MMDDPRHAQIRRLVSSGLTPRMIRRVNDDLRRRARALLDDVDAGVAFDFLADIAAELPMQMICILLGVPESERHWLFEADRAAIRFRRCPQGGGRAALARRGRIADVRIRHQLIAQTCGPQRRHVVGGGRRTIEMRRRTCRTWSSICSSTCCSVPGPRPPATRWPGDCWHSSSSPSRCGACSRSRSCCRRRSRRWCAGPRRRRRSAAPRPARSTLGGCDIAPGDKVQVWEGSANRDPAVFQDADIFDIARKPNAHLGFGQGVHYCLGANLARLELRVLFEELLPRFAPRGWSHRWSGPAATGTPVSGTCSSTCLE